MPDEHHITLVQGFEALQPETSVNWKKSEDPNQQIRLSDEILAFIEKSEIEAELKDKVCPSITCCLFFLIANRIPEVGSQLSVHRRNLWMTHSL